MNYYQQLLTDISVRESAVDCGRCETIMKCCTYRPFIANFLAGGAMKLKPFTEELFLDWDFSIAGLSPSLKYRKQFLKKGKWGFGTDATLLCTFYEKSSGGCQIWSSRPAVCRTFFCKSSYGDKGMEYWKNAEEFTWLLEWVLLEDFLFTQGWTIGDVDALKKYLDEKNAISGTELPMEYRFADLKAAEDFYSKARDHVSGLGSEYVMEIVGERGRQLYQDILAVKAKIR